MPSGSDGYVLLRGGLAVPVAPVVLLFALEQRGLSVSREGDYLVVRPKGRLTDEDRRQLARWKAHLLALIDYRPPTEVH
jgi:hypothetical protein